MFYMWTANTCILYIYKINICLELTEQWDTYILAKGQEKRKWGNTLNKSTSLPSDSIRIILHRSHANLHCFTHSATGLHPLVVQRSCMSLRDSYSPSYFHNPVCNIALQWQHIHICFCCFSLWERAEERFVFLIYVGPFWYKYMVLIHILDFGCTLSTGPQNVLCIEEEHVSAYLPGLGLAVAQLIGKVLTVPT